MKDCHWALIVVGAWNGVILGLVIALIIVMIVSWEAYGGQHTGFCRTTATSLMLSRSANSEEGKKNPYIQMLFSAHIGMCERVANKSITPEMAKLVMGGLEQILTIAEHTPRDTAMLHRVVTELEARARVEAIE